MSIRAYLKFLIIYVLFIIFCGSYVRSTGSGLGCPDWPKCFGSWIPPTSYDQLPLHFKQLLTDNTTLRFSVFQTWIEYLNRLVVTVFGFFVLIFVFISKKHNLLKHSITLLALTLIQAGIGKFVVSTHLKPLIISLHMLFTFSILFTLLSAYFKVDKKLRNKRPAKSFSYIFIAIFIIQLTLGLITRSQVDLQNNNNLPLNMLDFSFLNSFIPFIVHKYLSIIFMLYSYIGFVKYNNSTFKNLFILIIIQKVSGYTLTTFPESKFIIIPCHITLAFMISICLFQLWKETNLSESTLLKHNSIESK